MRPRLGFGSIGKALCLIRIDNIVTYRYYSSVKTTIRAVGACKQVYQTIDFYFSELS